MAIAPRIETYEHGCVDTPDHEDYPHIFCHDMLARFSHLEVRGDDRELMACYVRSDIKNREAPYAPEEVFYINMLALELREDIAIEMIKDLMGEIEQDVLASTDADLQNIPLLALRNHYDQRERIDASFEAGEFFDCDHNVKPGERFSGIQPFLNVKSCFMQSCNQVTAEDESIETSHQIAAPAGREPALDYLH